MSAPSPTTAGSPTTARARLAALAGHLGLALVATFPLLQHPTRDLVGSPLVDVWNHAWGPWWWATNLASGQLPWRTGYLNWPDGGVLWFIDPVLATLGAPLVGSVGVAGAYNAAILMMVAFASWAAGRLSQELGAGQGGRWVASAAFAASAWVVCEVHNGISEAVDVGPVALALALVERAARRPSLARWAGAGAAVGLSAIASPYLGLGVAVAAVIRGAPAISTAWLGGLVAAVVAAPSTLAMRAQLGDVDAIIKHPEEMNAQLALHNAVDPRTFFAPFGFRSVDLSAEGFEHSMYLGLVACALALGGVVIALSARSRLRRSAALWVLAGAACAVFSLGPFLYWDGAFIENAAGSRYRLPWWGFQRLVPGLAVTHPLRLAVPTLALVAGFAGVGASHLWARAREKSARLAPALMPLLVVAVLADGLLISGAPWPLETADATPPAAHAAIHRAGGEVLQWGVLDLPTDAGMTMATSRYLVWQAGHRRPIPYNPDARANTSALVNSDPFRVFAQLSDRRPDANGSTRLASPAGDTHPAGLKRNGIRWIVVHPSVDPTAAAAIRAELERTLGAGTEVDGAWRWDLGE